MNKKSTTIIIILIVLIGSFLFYWSQMRPMGIIKNCNESATEEAKSGGGIFSQGAKERSGDYDREYKRIYENCLRENGLEK